MNRFTRNRAMLEHENGERVLYERNRENYPNSKYLELFQYYIINGLRLFVISSCCVNISEIILAQYFRLFNKNS